MRRCFALACILSAVIMFQPSARAEVGVKTTSAGVEVTVDGQPFTTYLFNNSGQKPILWPVLGPTGKEMTRAWPLRRDNPEEKTDHPHQKSFWFVHGDVSRVNFWLEPTDPTIEKAKSEKKQAEPKEKKEKKDSEPLWQGKQEHRQLIKAEGGKVGTIVTATEWIDAEHEQAKMLSDVRTLRFGGNKEMRWIDFDVVVTAAKDGVAFRDTKEGSFGLRIAESMRVDRGGKVMTSEGLTDGGVVKDPMPCWGKPAAWVDYSGSVGGEKLGIAILNHPSSFRYPNRWHVRVYGLFAANPWGLHGFNEGPEKGGEYTMKKGDSIALRYRVIFHKGDDKEGKIAEAFAAYTKE